ncbi:MAG: undecaprenyldiphospho-muramoylpentapeptide beta-N-acetylglucosaminyltransferase [Treponema sp.]|jgi:UDP-N-acetylglucosamine--N-acetylmuramyl-(pentapeptide) pyrophosphoryl-undecaprenol N-acetylglucosamine transferase|nr:undecaprenyldiphospho-muramoylpentapeptide beta-N-acetylglucosaminyltransferase [Treponema sp.]
MVSIAFTGGGTGGHIYPGLAVASRVKERLPCRIFWIGSNTGMDRAIVEEAGLEFFGIPSGRLRRYFSLKTVPDFFRVLAGFFAARRVLRAQRPLLLFSKGGFVSVPPCAAAAGLGIPVFTHESDFSPGLATRINARFAARGRGRIFAAYGDTAAFFPPSLRDRVTVSGNPVRSAFRDADAGKGRAFLDIPPGESILLVLGGSQGARDLNELVREALPELTKYYTVVHQTGPKNCRDLPAAEKYRPYPYIGAEMPHVLAAADLVLGRSGAGTVWECAVAGKPMVLVPLSGSGTRGDQVENAGYFERRGAALALSGGGLDGRLLGETIGRLALDGERRRAMAAAAAAIGKVDGAALIAEAVLEIIGEKIGGIYGGNRGY